MRAFVLALLIPLAACDSGVEPPDPDASPLVGSWALIDRVSETRVVSNTDQQILDITATGEGTLDVTGAVTASLRYLWFIDRQQPGREEVVFSTVPRAPAEGVPLAFLSVGNGLGAGLNWLPEGIGGPEMHYEASGEIPFDYADGRFTVTTTLRAGDGSEVRVVGALAFPLVRLVAGRETAVDVAQEATNGRAVSFTSQTFTETAEGDVIRSGAWHTDGDALELRVGGRAPDYRSEPRISYEVTGETLRLVYTNDGGCTDECVPAFAASRFAAPASIDRVRYVTTETYQRAR